MPDTQRRATVGGVLDDAAERLHRAGVPHARREATALWAALEGVSAGAVWLRREREVGRGGELSDFWRAVERRAAGTPFAYATGRASFRHLELAMDPRALIPRPETEAIVDIVLQWARNVQRGAGTWGVAADIGTGSGCLALALAVEGAFDRVVAIERSAEAAALARENVALVAPRVPVDVREGSLLAPLAGERCRAIVSNPPYLSEREYEEVDDSVRRFEPREALVGGPDGLQVTRALLRDAPACMEPGGLIALEIDERRAAAVAAFATASGWRGVTIRNDLFGRPRFAVATAPEDA